LLVWKHIFSFESKPHCANGDETIDEPGLVVPHPRLKVRDFVLRPLAELVPTLKIPGDGTVQDALAGLSSEA